MSVKVITEIRPAQGGKGMKESAFMKKARRATSAAAKQAKIQEWYSFEQPGGEILHDTKYFFAFEDGCWIGTYGTHEEALESLLLRQSARKAEYQI